MFTFLYTAVTFNPVEQAETSRSTVAHPSVAAAEHATTWVAPGAAGATGAISSG